MTPKRRWRSPRVSAAALQKTGWWCVFFAASFFFLLSSPIGAPGKSFSPLSLWWIGQIFLPLLLWPWTAGHPGWGLAAWFFSGALATLVAAAAGQIFLFWLPAEFAGASLLGLWLKGRWETALASLRVRGERLEEEIHATQGELTMLSENHQSLRERLRQYQRLQDVANGLSSFLSLEELVEEIVRESHQLVPGDLVLLYLVAPEKLTLELKSVWRRIGNAPIKAKTGDSFDLWVMRQGQPLLVTDILKEFRFPKPTPEELGRELGSFVAVPLMSGQRFLGILRVEATSPNAFGDQELRLVRIMGDLTSLAIENARLYGRVYELAITDDLTGLALRRHFEKRGTQVLESFQKGGGPLSLLMIDIDRFKDYNDTFGHSAGDKLLKWIAQVLMQQSLPGEIVGRFGGEEFTCMLPGVGKEGALGRAEAIRSKVEETPVQLRRALTKTTVSIGVASFPDDGRDVQELLRAADECLYRAKRLGRNRVCSLGF